MLLPLLFSICCTNRIYIFFLKIFFSEFYNYFPFMVILLTPFTYTYHVCYSEKYLR